MTSHFSPRKKKVLIWVISVVATLAILVGACALYVSDYYRADTAALAAFRQEAPVTKQIIQDNITAYGAQDATAGLIFYPGGKVEHLAYEPLMQACAQRGIFCVLVEMPFRLAVLDINAAEGIQEQFPEIEKWYIGGHSLGGSMAGAYLAAHTKDFAGYVLLGSYCTEDLSDTNLDVLSVYGSEDKVLNLKKYKENKSNLPPDFTEHIIEGGCHAYFGMYGNQTGDGAPTITNKEQIHITADAIAALVNS